MGEILSIVLLVALFLTTRRSRQREQRLEERVELLELQRVGQAGQLKQLEEALAALPREAAVARAPLVPEPSRAPPPAAAAPELAPQPWTGALAVPADLRGTATPAQSNVEAVFVAPLAEASASEAARVGPEPGAATRGAAPASGEPGAPPAGTAEAEAGAAEPAAVAAGVAPPSSAPPAFDWERWVGVRGAAVVGASVLALAGVLFFRYAVKHALLPPAARVIIGVLTGVGCLLGAERLRARYAVTANALAGGGLVISYAAIWAARVLYELIGMEVAFALMALTTATGCLLAVRHGALVIAVLGLLGGFATPLLLSTGSDRPIGLFGYILLLDLGFVLAARKRGWGSLLSLALVGTLLIEGAWIVLRMGPDRLLLGVAVVAVFGVFFAWAGRKPANAPESWSRTQVAAVVLPFGFALYFATRARLGAELPPLAALLSLLAFGAGWVARRVPEASWLPLSSAVACVTIVGVWLGQVPYTPAACWQAALCSAGLGLVFQLRSELSCGERQASRAAAIAHLGLLALLVLGSLSRAAPAELEPWLTGWSLLAALATVQARFPGYGGLSLAAAPLLALGLATFHAQRLWPQQPPQLRLHFALETGIAVVLHIVSLARRKLTDHAAAALFPGTLLLCLAFTPSLGAQAPNTVLGASLALGALTLFGATHLGDARALALAALPLLAAQQAGAFSPILAERSAVLALGWLGSAMLLVTAWPLFVLARLRHPRWALYTSALAGPLWFLSLRHVYAVAWGSSAIGLLPALLGALSLGVLWHVRRSRVLEPQLLRSALAWYAAVALGFLSVAIPLQLARQWITIGWALESAAVLLLFRRLNHAGLKWLGLVLGLLVSARLVLNPSLLDYGERGLPFLNWLLYTYWLPALALIAGYRALRDIELERLRPWERGVYSAQPLGALGLGLAAILVVFVWLNLSIFDAFAQGERLLLDLERRPTRDLVLSLAWAAYAGMLLALGMVRRARGLRWLSLGLLILTIGKVFLYDLGQLKDLYQVLSLVGLAFSLIAVSLAYQRFVFRKGSS